LAWKIFWKEKKIWKISRGSAMVANGRITAV
jgi:hypothetical protein